MSPEEGFQNDLLRDALTAGLGGRPVELERLLCRAGAVLTPRPNMKLAAAFGAEMSAYAGKAARLLTRLAGDDAAPDTDRAFLPIAAAHGWAGRVRAHREVEEAWLALAHLAADERSPVRVGTLDALLSLGVREGGADELVERGLSWLRAESDAGAAGREARFGTAALVVEVLGDRRVLSRVRDGEPLLAYLSLALTEVTEAPRSAERSDARRRLLMSLPGALAAVIANPAMAERAQSWFAAECARADRTDVRHALSAAILALRSPAHGQSVIVIETLRGALQGSAKPLRDPSRLRPGTGRGKASRRTR